MCLPGHFRRAAARSLEQYSWPGNVRELRQVIERAFILAEESKGTSGPTFSSGECGENSHV